MTTTTVHAFPIPADALDRMRADGHDDFGNPFATGEAGGGEPLRCCLRPASRGEQVALISYSPHHRPSVWAEVGPVFVHPSRCSGYDPSRGLPDELRTGPRLLRSYRADGSMNYDAIVTVDEGTDIEDDLAALLRRPDVAQVHVRATQPQCFTYAVLVSEA